MSRPKWDEPGDHRPIDHVETLPVAVLDALRLDAVVVDADCRAIWMSETAARRFEAVCGIEQIAGCTLKSLLPQATGRLHGAARAALDGRPAEIVIESAASGRPVLVRALPLAARRAPSGGRSAARHALILLSEPEQENEGDASIVETRLVQLYLLTPMEAKVARMLAAGRKTAEVADLLGIAVSTAHTHTTRVYAKTGFRRQSTLARAVARLR